ncbi:MAG: COG4223 family protein, partial [Reyranellales bacterium]
VIVLAVALLSLPYWPQEARNLWRGPAAAPAAAPATPVLDTAQLDAAKREINARLDDLDKKVRAAANTAAQAGPSDNRPAAPDPAIAELRRKVEALESKPQPEADTSALKADTSALKSEIVALRAALQSLDQIVAGQKSSVDKATEAATASVTHEQKALAAARGSAVVAVAAHISAAVAAGLPFATDLTLLRPLTRGDDKGDAKLTELIGTLQPVAAKGVASRASLAATFPAMAKAAMADDLADNSFWQRLLGKLKSVVSLRRIGADVEGDSVEARLARAEAAANAGDVAKAVELVMSLPPQTSRATADWLARANAHLAAQHAVDQLAAQGVALLESAH